MHKVYFYESFTEEAVVLRELLPANIEPVFLDATTQESGHTAPPTRLITTRTQSQVPVEWADSLDGILTRSTGYDHLLEIAARGRRAPALGYLPYYCHRAVAEHALMLWMALLRRLPQQTRQLHKFYRDEITGDECQGRTLVVVGVGVIGREICRIGKALGMSVLGVDLDPRFEEIEYVASDAALPQADIVVCAMNLNASNRGYFDASRLRQFKEGALFVNIARGEMSPSTALLEALKAGRLAGVGLDVYDHEPEFAVALRSGQTTDDAEVQAALELARMDSAICTPHNAFNSQQALRRKSEHSVRQLVHFLENGKFEWTVPVGRTF